MSVTFNVKKPNPAMASGFGVETFAHAACFVHINNRKFSEGEIIEYFVNKGHNTEEEVYWYHGKLNRLGLYSELFDDGGRYVFHVHPRGPYIRTFAKLTALRYLDESPFPKMVTAMYNWSKKYPEIPFFVLFQLSHYIHDSINAGHAFMECCGPYNQTPRSLVSIATFQKNFRDKGIRGKKKDSPLVYYTPIGLNNLILNEKIPRIKVNAKNFLHEVRKGDLNKAIDMITVPESAIKKSDLVKPSNPNLVEVF